MSAILKILRRVLALICGSGGTADALASGASWSNPVGVQIPPSAPTFALIAIVRELRSASQPSRAWLIPSFGLASQPCTDGHAKAARQRRTFVDPHGT